MKRGNGAHRELQRELRPPSAMDLRGPFSVLLIGLPVYALIMWPGRESLGTAVLGVACWLIISYLFLFLLPWRVELTADEFRWHAVLRTGAVPLSRVRSIRRGDRSRVYFKIDGVGGAVFTGTRLIPSSTATAQRCTPLSKLTRWPTGLISTAPR